MKNLLERHRKAIELLVQGSTPDEVAKEVGVVVSTLAEWMTDKVFLRGWKTRRMRYITEAIKFTDLSERVPSVVAAILNSSSESNRLRATEVWMKGLEAEKKREEEISAGQGRIRPEDLEEGERQELLRNGTLVGIGEHTGDGYKKGIKYFEELTVQELEGVLQQKVNLSLRCGKASIWLGGLEFAITNPEERLNELDNEGKRLLEELKEKWDLIIPTDEELEFIKKRRNGHGIMSRELLEN